MSLRKSDILVAVEFLRNQTSAKFFMVNNFCLFSAKTQTEKCMSDHEDMFLSLSLSFSFFVSFFFFYFFFFFQFLHLWICSSFFTCSILFFALCTSFFLVLFFNVF